MIFQIHQQGSFITIIEGINGTDSQDAFDLLLDCFPTDNPFRAGNQLIGYSGLCNYGGYENAIEFYRYLFNL